VDKSGNAGKRGNLVKPGDMCKPGKVRKVGNERFGHATTWAMWETLAKGSLQEILEMYAIQALRVIWAGLITIFFLPQAPKITRCQCYKTFFLHC
jgi:hypothetical protein